MFNPSKCDAELGARVEANLRNLKLQTPTNYQALNVPEEAKIETIRHNMAQIMTVLGLDLDDDSLKDTPLRIAKMYSRELMWGLLPQHFPKITVIDNKMGYNEMLIEKDVTVMSLCEHHLVTIEGKAHIAYFPDEKVVGLSKFNRVVEYFSRRPQVQERLTSQIFETLKFLLGTEDVAVVIDAHHYCVISRGVEDESSHTITSALGGRFLEPTIRAEFMALIR